MSEHRPPVEPDRRAPERFHVAVIAARWNAAIVERLLEGCLMRLAELGVSAERREVFRVPGSLELPVAARAAATCGRFHAVVVLGCVIRGETWHFEAVAGQCVAGVRQVAVETGVPVIFGVLTVDTEAQALARSGGEHGHAGRDAADAAVETALTVHRIAGTFDRVFGAGGGGGRSG